MRNKDDIIQIKIDDLSVEGAGIGHDNGFTVFIPRALPDEIVRVKIIKATKHYAVARMLDIETKSEARVEPFCTVFNSCGGCTLQHLAYQAQLAYKTRFVKECFERLGGIQIEEPEIIASGLLYGYRNKASFPVDEIDGHPQAGFYAPRSHKLVVADCPIQKQPVNDVKNAVIKWAAGQGVAAYDEASQKGTLRHVIGRVSSTGEVMAGVVAAAPVDERTLAEALGAVEGIKSVVVNTNKDKTNVILGRKNRVIYGEPFITEVYDGLSFRAGLLSFLQVNHEQSEKLYQLALDFAEISGDDVVFDLFCGIGTLSLLAARKAKTVVGIEYMQSAIDNARENASLNGLSNAVFFAGDAGKMMDACVKQAGRPDIVLLDPPRKGCDRFLIDQITAVSPKKIVYVSCNPATLARDAALFVERGYTIETVRCVDMFPHTTHVECCCLLSRV